MLSLIGFLVVFAIIYCIMSKRLTVMVSLAIIPILGVLVLALLVDKQHFFDLPKYLNAGLSKVAVNGVMFVFAIMFFGTMMTAGAFDPVVNRIVRWCGGNPLYISIGTYILSIVGHLDGSATTTVLLVTTAMLPIYDRMKMRKRNLACILAMGAGTMNISPWGGPTLRAATVLDVELIPFFQPMLIPIILTLAVGFVVTIFIGRGEQKRLAASGELLTEFDDAHLEEKKENDELARPKMTAINLVLILAVVGLMIFGVLSPQAAFMTGTAIAFILNYPKATEQAQIIRLHGANVVMVVSALYGAGILMGVLGSSGMAKAMAETIVAIIPDALGRFIPFVIGMFAVPFSMIFDADTFYYGILPVICESLNVMGIPPANVCYAALVGQLTIGWAITPLTPATLLLTGLCGLELGEHQKYTLKFVWPLSIVLLVFLAMFGLII